MQAQDQFIGVCAAVIGCLVLAGAALNGRWLMSLTKSRLLTESIGPAAARWTLGLLGVIIIALGLLIASGQRLW